MPIQTLRQRLLLAVVSASVVCFSFGTAIAMLRATHSVRVELSSALRGARDSVAALPPASVDERDGQSVCAIFRDNRHVTARVVSREGRVLCETGPLASSSPPSWFLRTVAPKISDALLAVGRDGRTVNLSADPTNEAAERWSDFLQEIVVVGALSALMAGLCGAIVSRGLKPLGALTFGLSRLGKGETGIVLSERGPREVSIAAAAFNRMALALRDANERNARLQEQLACIAEEERAAFARDLHDEVGALLFGINTFAAAIEHSLAGERIDTASAQIKTLKETTRSAQQVVREMLDRLHGNPTCDVPLRIALEDMKLFWKAVAPSVAIDTNIQCDIESLNEETRVVLAHVAQEALSNAIRHGAPKRVSLSVVQESSMVRLVIHDDGSAQAASTGFGLLGMKRRAEIIGGSLEIRQESGWTVILSVPDDRVTSLTGAYP
ncbi:HAMP domain-containing protein [Acetobacter sacchari]|uniref:HAMP domain-containing protein n=1 Tax=Acetobacter sacchari TaxID=2661687 RepID=A0ABS3LVS6_9PROT|nr:histidine kinase [Acetobacter sacchari]MBO1360009.1 HAMP domain-containing protein [Acetobacter sacchari]